MVCNEITCTVQPSSKATLVFNPSQLYASNKHHQFTGPLCLILTSIVVSIPTHSLTSLINLPRSPHPPYSRDGPSFLYNSTESKSRISVLALSIVSNTTSLASAISGGQRKRVSIGLELAAAPMALFLNEPTSGLESVPRWQLWRC